MPDAPRDPFALPPPPNAPVPAPRHDPAFAAFTTPAGDLPVPGYPVRTAAPLTPTTLPFAAPGGPHAGPRPSAHGLAPVPPSAGPVAPFHGAAAPALPALPALPGVATHGAAMTAPAAPTRHPAFRVLTGGLSGLPGVPGGTPAGLPIGVTPYPFTAPFAQAIAYRLATSREAWATLGQWVDAALLPDPSAALIVEATRAIASERGMGPCSMTLVLQRINRWVDAGTHRRSDLAACAALALRADEDEEAGAPWPTVADVLAEAVPLLQARHRRRVVAEASMDAAAGNGLAAAAEKMLAVERIGVSTSDLGEGFDVLAAAPEAQSPRHSRVRIPMGLPEVDYLLGGGPWRGTVMLVAGSTGGAKSMTLIAVAAATMLHGPDESVLYATMELQPPDINTRLRAHITGVPLGALETHEGRGIAARFLAAMRGRVGDWRVKKFPDGEVTVADLEAWVDDYERTTRRKVTRLIVDGVDHVAPPPQKMKQRDGSYEAGRLVMRGLEALAQDRGISVIASSHVQRGLPNAVQHPDGTRLPSKDCLADSKHRQNAADFVVGITVRADAADARVKWTYVHMAKVRGAAGSDTILGPFRADLPHARIVEITGSAGPRVMVNGVSVDPSAPPAAWGQQSLPVGAVGGGASGGVSGGTGATPGSPYASEPPHLDAPTPMPPPRGKPHK